MLSKRSPLVVAAVAGAGLVALLVFALIATPAPAGDDLFVHRATTRCVDLWNAAENAAARAQFERLGRAAPASVGYARDAPKKCLISAVSPTGDWALQSLEAGGGAPFAAADEVIPDGLSDAVGGWNATIAGGGRIALN